MTNILSGEELLSEVRTDSTFVNELSQSLSREVLKATEEEGSKDLTPVTKCCLKKKCYEKVLAKVQNDLFNNFWRIGDYAKQNYFLVGLMAAQSPKQKTSRPLKKNKSLSWKYWVDIRGRKVQVCKGFFLAVYGVSDKRLRVLQTKLVNGEPLEDQRGKYDKERRANQHTVKKKVDNGSDQLKKANKKKKTDDNELNSSIITNNGLFLSEIIIPQSFAAVLNT